MPNTQTVSDNKKKKMKNPVRHDNRTKCHRFRLHTRRASFGYTIYAIHTRHNQTSQPTVSVTLFIPFPSSALLFLRMFMGGAVNLECEIRGRGFVTGSGVLSQSPVTC